MSFDWLLNPWTLIILAIAYVGGNIMALKYTANMKPPKTKDSFKEMARQQETFEDALNNKQELSNVENKKENLH